MDGIDGWVARQAEVDTANAEAASTRSLYAAETARADDALAQLSTANQLNTALNDQVTALQTKNAALTLQVTDLTQQLGDVRKQLEACKNPTPPPVDPTPPPPPPVDPPPTSTATKFGACIASAGAAGVVTKFGSGASIRQFMSSTLTWPSVPAGSLMQVSYYVATYTDAQIDALLKAAKGHLVTVHHEPDNDGMTAAQMAEWKALNNRFYDRNVALGRPALIAPTFTGGLFASYGTDAKRDSWMTGLKGDLLGIDFDGVHSDQTTKPADLIYRAGGKEITNADEIANVKRYLSKYAANGWRGFTVPEFGTSRAKWDTTGEGRAKWINDNAKRFIDAGAYAVQWYDYHVGTVSDAIDVGTPEHTAMKALVARNK